MAKPKNITNFMWFLLIIIQQFETRNTFELDEIFTALKIEEEK